MKTKAVLSIISAAAAALAWFNPAAAQGIPTPTPEVVTTASGNTFVVHQSVTYGEGAIVTMLVLIAGLLLVMISLHVAEWVRKNG